MCVLDQMCDDAISFYFFKIIFGNLKGKKKFFVSYIFCISLGNRISKKIVSNIFLAFFQLYETRMKKWLRERIFAHICVFQKTRIILHKRAQFSLHRYITT